MVRNCSRGVRSKAIHAQSWGKEWNFGWRLCRWLRCVAAHVAILICGYGGFAWNLYEQAIYIIYISWMRRVPKIVSCMQTRFNFDTVMVGPRRDGPRAHAGLHVDSDPEPLFQAIPGQSSWFHWPARCTISRTTMNTI